MAHVVSNQSSGGHLSGWCAYYVRLVPLLLLLVVFKSCCEVCLVIFSSHYAFNLSLQQTQTQGEALAFDWFLLPFANC